MRRKLGRQELLIALLVVLVIAYLALLWLPSHGEPSYSTTNYSQIEDGLYLGGFLGEPPPGTRAVLNLCERKDPYEAEVHRWESIPDSAPAPSIDWLRKQVDFVDQQRQAELPVFVHCAAGISRSGLVTAAYLMARDGCSRDQALATIRARRHIVSPNPAFMQLLLEWEETLKGAKKK
jgi:hypothetical protein